MPPIECVEKGCHDRMIKMETRLDHIDNSEGGALGQLHEKMNAIGKGKVSWKLFVAAMTLALGFTSISTAGLYTSRKDLFEKQDKYIQDLNAAQNTRIEEALQRIEKMQAALDLQVISLYEHRIYTGERVKKSENVNEGK